MARDEVAYFYLTDRRRIPCVFRQRNIVEKKGVTVAADQRLAPNIGFLSISNSENGLPYAL